MTRERQNDLKNIVREFLDRDDEDYTTEGIDTAKEMAFCMTLLEQYNEEDEIQEFCYSVLDSSSE